MKTSPINFEKTLKTPTIGADIEVFLKEKGGDSDFTNYVPAATFMEDYPKENPLNIKPNLNIHWDNVSLEYDVVPATTLLDFVNNCAYAVDGITSWCDDREVSPIHLAGINRTSIYPADHDSLEIYGCAPSLNCWTGQQNPPPYSNPDTRGYRFSGGHIHIGTTTRLTVPEKHALVRTLDLVVGLKLASLIPSELVAFEQARATTYGLPGSFRLKPYGVEYRVPSSYLFSPSMRNHYFTWFFNKALPAIQANPFLVDKLIKDDEILKHLIPRTLQGITQSAHLLSTLQRSKTFCL